MMRKLLILFFIFCCTLFLFAGCGLVENVRIFKDSNNGDAVENQGESAEKDTTDASGNSIISSDSSESNTNIPSTDDEGKSTNESDATNDVVTDPKDTINVVLYFASSDGSSLEPETRAIPRQEGVARATVNQLLSGPESDGLAPTLPTAALLEDINISNGICTVDFSLELIDDMSADSQDQMLAVYSIVNTLTQFDSVEKVRILVNGQTINGGLGGIDLSTALAPVSF